MSREMYEEYKKNEDEHEDEQEGKIENILYDIYCEIKYLQKIQTPPVNYIYVIAASVITSVVTSFLLR